MQVGTPLVCTLTPTFQFSALLCREYTTINQVVVRPIMSPQRVQGILSKMMDIKSFPNSLQNIYPLSVPIHSREATASAGWIIQPNRALHACLTLPRLMVTSMTDPFSPNSFYCFGVNFDYLLACAYGYELLLAEILADIVIQRMFNSPAELLSPSTSSTTCWVINQDIIIVGPANLFSGSPLPVFHRQLESNLFEYTMHMNIYNRSKYTEVFLMVMVMSYIAEHSFGAISLLD